MKHKDVIEVLSKPLECTPIPINVRLVAAEGGYRLLKRSSRIGQTPLNRYKHFLKHHYGVPDDVSSHAALHQPTGHSNTPVES
jgi:hypothetical protein